LAANIFRPNFKINQIAIQAILFQTRFSLHLYGTVNWKTTKVNVCRTKVTVKKQNKTKRSLNEVFLLLCYAIKPSRLLQILGRCSLLSWTLMNIARSTVSFKTIKCWHYSGSHTITDTLSFENIQIISFGLLQGFVMAVGMDDQFKNSLDLYIRLYRDTSWEIRCWSVYNMKPDWSSCHND